MHIRYLVIVMLFVTVPLYGSSQQKTAPKQPDWVRFVSQAYTMSHNFSPEEKADLLLDILSLPPATLGSAKAERYSLELFSLSTKELKPSHYRAAMQKNALIALCKVNPTKAAELYTTQDTPDMWNQKVLMEDYRAFGARTLFPSLWQQSGISSIPTIRRIANWIGSTGEYPFAGTLMVIQEIPDSQKPVAETLVSDAIASYEATKGFVDKDSEFTDFIVGIHNRVRSTLVREAIEAELGSLDAMAKEENSAHFVVRAASQQQTVQFSNQAEYILYRLLPIMSDMDPAWAESTKEKYPVLRNLPSPNGKNPTTVTGAVTPPGQTASSSDVSDAMDEHRLMQVNMISENDPARAAGLANSIQDPGRRAVALATLAPSYSRIDPQQADTWIRSSNTELESLPPGKTKLQLMVALARDSLLNKDEKRATALFDKAFDLGEELFEEDSRSNPGKMAYESDGEEELAKLLETFAKQPGTRVTAVARVQSTRDDVLKAKLLVAVAKGAAPAQSIS